VGSRFQISTFKILDKWVCFNPFRYSLCIEAKLKTNSTMREFRLGIWTFVGKLILLLSIKFVALLAIEDQLFNCPSLNSFRF